MLVAAVVAVTVGDNGAPVFYFCLPCCCCCCCCCCYLNCDTCLVGMKVLTTENSQTPVDEPVWYVMLVVLVALLSAVIVCFLVCCFCYCCCCCLAAYEIC